MTATSPGRQRGAALLTAMIIVALVATLAASMLWQQWRSVQVEAAERARTQSAWILSGALDWARLILREDLKSGGPPVDHLGEPWAVPLAEARLSSFLANGDANVEDAPDAFLSGAITDAQARFNLRDLVSGNQVDPAQLAAFKKLCVNAGVADSFADQIANGMRNALPPAPPASGTSAPQSAQAAARPADPPLLPLDASQLTWFGVPAEVGRALEPYVVILPEWTPINANTTSPEVLAATAGLDVGTAQRIVQSRQRTPLKSIGDLNALAPGMSDADKARFSVSTNYFEVRGRLRLGSIVLEQRSLVHRISIDNIVVVRRERVSSRDVRS